MNVCSRLDLFQTGTTSTAALGQLLKCAELGLGLMGEAIADAKRQGSKGEHESLH